MKHAQLYPLVGILLGWGAPVGAVLLRFFILPGPPQPLYRFTGQDWAQNAFFYWYMAVGTCLAFAVTGYLLGRQKDLKERR